MIFTHMCHASVIFVSVVTDISILWAIISPVLNRKDQNTLIEQSIISPMLNRKDQNTLIEQSP